MTTRLPRESMTTVKTHVNRRTVDLDQYPDLVVVYLGMRVNMLAGIKTVFRLGPQIQEAGAAGPEGLLHCEQNIIYGFFPFHVGMRWYWRDFASLEAWTRSAPHREWWTNFLRDSAARASGTRRTACVAVWKRSTMTCRGSSALRPSHRSLKLGAACFPLGAGWNCEATRRRSPKGYRNRKCTDTERR